jgi:hypothetical protein
VVDAAALAQFQEQWETNRKLVESGCLAHREVGAILRETLNDVLKSPSASSTSPAATPV